jgi:predicted nucleic acid-binding protein
VIVLLDTNIVIDVLQKRPAFFEDSYAVLALAARAMVTAIIPAGCIADIAYILQRAGRTTKQARNDLVALTQLVSLTDTTASDVITGLASTMTDTEVAILAATAQRSGATWIITRNTRDFTDSVIPAITPTDFLKLMRDPRTT